LGNHHYHPDQEAALIHPHIAHRALQFEHFSTPSEGLRYLVPFLLLFFATLTLLRKNVYTVFAEKLLQVGGKYIFFFTRPTVVLGIYIVFAERVERVFWIGNLGVW
jgi:hypothetical protein